VAMRSSWSRISRSVGTAGGVLIAGFMSVGKTAV
jgi:hypothetical protein